MLYDNVITAFYSTFHPTTPLIVLPHLRLMYLQDDPTNVYSIKWSSGGRSGTEILPALMEFVSHGYEFILRHRRFTVCISNENRQYSESISLRTWNWQYMQPKVVQIQRFWKRRAHERSKMYRDMLVMAFVGSGMSRFPPDVLSMIGKNALDRNHRPRNLFPDQQIMMTKGFIREKEKQLLVVDTFLQG